MKFFLRPVLSLCLLITTSSYAGQHSWRPLNNWLSQQIKEDRLLAVPKNIESLPKSQSPKSMGNILYSYLWLFEQYKKIAISFGKTLSVEQIILSKTLKTLCKKNYHDSCYHPLSHRNKLIESHPLPPIQWP